MSKSYLGQGINEQTLETMLELKKRALLVEVSAPYYGITLLWKTNNKRQFIKKLLVINILLCAVFSE